MGKKRSKLTPIPTPRARQAKPVAAPTSAPADSGPDLSHIAPGLLHPELVALADLAFMTGNAVTHPDEQIGQLRASIKRFQQVEPLVVNRRETPPVVLGGNGRLQAMLADGYTHAVVCFVDLDRPAANALSLTLNGTADGRLYDKAALDALLRDLDTNNDPVLDALMAGLAKDQGLYATEVPAPELPTGDKAPFQQMTFTLHDSQADAVQKAIDKAKSAGPFTGSPNENSNGNALARMAEAYLGHS